MARVTGDATRFPAFMSAGAADDTRLTRAAAGGSGAELLGMGFDMVFAPDADVTIGPPTRRSARAARAPAPRWSPGTWSRPARATRTPASSRSSSTSPATGR